MNASILSALFASAVSIDLPVHAPAGARPAAVRLPACDEGARRNRYPSRAFGIGYGSSQGYARQRSYFATPSLSRYR